MGLNLEIAGMGVGCRNGAILCLKLWEWYKTPSKWQEEQATAAAAAATAESWYLGQEQKMRWFREAVGIRVEREPPGCATGLAESLARRIGIIWQAMLTLKKTL